MYPLINYRIEIVLGEISFEKAQDFLNLLITILPANSAAKMEPVTEEEGVYDEQEA